MQFKRSRRSSRASGFTLIELLIALAVLLIGLSALWGLHAAAITNNANAHRLGMATILAQDALEDLYGETWIDGYSNPRFDLTDCGGTFPIVTTDGLEPLPCNVEGGSTTIWVNSLANTTATLAPVSYLRTYHVELIGAGTNRMLVRVRVTFSDPGTGKRHGVTMGATRMQDGYDPLGLGS